MRDLQHRLCALGFDTSGDEPGRFGPGTAAALAAFQDKRRLPSDGACDAVTWDALVEAGWRLGDRPLYVTSPMLRGDDVAVLQRALGNLGFDAGRVDGIYGARTDRALADFQRNAGLVTDGICGPATVAALARLGDWLDGDSHVSNVREREHYRRGPRSLSGRVVAVGHAGGLDALATSLARSVTAAGGTALVVQHPDGSEQASQANAIDADVFIGLALLPSDATVCCRAGYYASPTGWASRGGKLLAELVHAAWAPILGCPAGAVSPLTLPILRETRMAAVLTEVGPPAAVVEQTAALASALPAVLDGWVCRISDGT